MMSYEYWIKQLLDVMKDVADREYQIRRWLAPDSKAWEHPSELMNVIYDDLTFELFVEMRENRITAEQLLACKRFDRVATHWCDSTPAWPNLQETIDSPDWIKVREAAAALFHAFSESG
jgi:hypothetical protein